MSKARELQQVLNEQIPISRAIGIEVSECASNKVVLKAPLEPNLNHKCTAFGGSLYSLAVLCGWSLVHCLMREHQLDGHIVIQHSEVDYKHPVDGEMIAICEVDDTSVLDAFIRRYQRKSLARIKLSVVVRYAQDDAVIFKGHYVVHH